MNYNYFKETKNTDKWLELNINEIQNKTLITLRDKGYQLITVLDSEYGDEYSINFQKSNLGYSALCFLNGMASRNGDAKLCQNAYLKDIINNIAATKILDENGNVIKNKENYEYAEPKQYISF